MVNQKTDSSAVPAEISAQLLQALSVLERHLSSRILAVHLYGSALEGGLKPYSDIDLLVTVSVPLHDSLRQSLMSDLLDVSAPPGQHKTLRALEVTVVVLGDIVPWRYPARRELQFGEWLRESILVGEFEPAVTDVDLAILLTKVRQNSIALAGLAAEDLFDPVVEDDFYRALSQTLPLWNASPDWTGDERNVVLTLARIWYSAVTGKITSKDKAAEWAVEWLPSTYQAALIEAQRAYLGNCDDRLDTQEKEVEGLILFMKHKAASTLMSRQKTGLKQKS